MPRKITVVLCRVGKPAKVTKIDATLEEYQKIVDGYIECAYPFEDSDVVVVVNGEGKLVNLPLNRALRDNDGRVLDIISGDFFVCRIGRDDFESLSKEQAKKYLDKFLLPEVIVYV